MNERLVETFFETQYVFYNKNDLKIAKEISNKCVTVEEFEFLLEEKEVEFIFDS